jgi:molybdate transport system regulatory protein
MVINRTAMKLSVKDDCGAVQAKLWLKIDLGERGQIGPGKIALLQLIGEKGSIAAAAREMGMSYRRAWLLVADMNRLAGAQVITTTTGGRDYGGAELTAAGLGLIETYQTVCRKAQEAVAGDLAFFKADQAAHNGN